MKYTKQAILEAIANLADEQVRLGFKHPWAIADYMAYYRCEDLIAELRRMLQDAED